MNPEDPVHPGSPQGQRKASSFAPGHPDEDLEKRFTYHRPGGNQAERYETIRSFAKSYAYGLKAICPSSRELSLALTQLEQVVFWANASIARNENPAMGGE